MVIFFNKLATENKANEEQLSLSTHSWYFSSFDGMFLLSEKEIQAINHIL